MVKTYRLAVCKGPHCRQGGADQIFSVCCELISRRGISALCEAYRGGCYGLCHLGPNVILRENPRPKDPLSREDFQLMGWEGEFHYPDMTVEKIARVLFEHVRDGRVLDELLRPAEAGFPSPTD